MAQPTPYRRSFSFQNWSASNPSDPQPGDKLDAQFNALQLTTDQLIANLGKIQRDDGLLANRTVGREQLREDITIGFNAPEPWAPNTSYGITDTVFYDQKFYSTKTAHVSGAVFDPTLWDLIADFTAVAAEAEAWANLAEEWAEKTDGPVETVPTNKYSAKHWATTGNVAIVAANIVSIDTVADNIQAVIDVPGNIDVAQIYAELAHEWAEKVDGPVSGGEFSAHYWANQAATAFQTNNWSTGGGTWDGVASTVTLPEDPVVDERVLFIEGGVPQRPYVDFTVVGTTLTRTNVPANGVPYFWVMFGSAEFKAVSDGGVSTPNKLANGVVTEPKLADNATSSRTIAPAAVTKPKIAPSSVDASKLDAGDVVAIQALLIPVGTIWAFGLPESAVPTGWIAPYGQQITGTYPTLRAALIAAGNPYGSAGGNPLAPDLRGRTPAGKDDMGGTAAGRLTNTGVGPSGVDGSVLGYGGGVDRHTLSPGQMPVHAHTGVTDVQGQHAHTYQDSGAGSSTSGDPGVFVADVSFATRATDPAGAHAHNFNTSNAGGGEAHPNVQPSIVVNYIMKAH